MPNLGIIMKIQVFLSVFAVLLVSCKKENSDPVYQKFVSKEVAVHLSKEYMLSLADVFSETYPAVSEIKPLIGSNVTVYKIIYRTTVNNSSIEASGLVCVPTTHGSYPVLSFQNGTNTLNSGAPSMDPVSYSFQMIEMIAAMGYVVVMPDYPGFGASATIPHPYLIRDATVVPIVDMFSAVKEFVPDISGIDLENEYYLLGYSQGGWATLALHKALELDYNSEFTLAGSACGAGPYDLNLMMEGITSLSAYQMPVYLGYILNAYSSYNHFTNPVSDIINEPYASRISTLYTGQLASADINLQLTTSVSDLFNPSFLEGFATAPEYATVRAAFSNNSISAWQTGKPLMLIHGANDTDVNPQATENMYSGMITAGTPQNMITKVIISGADHGQGVVPAILQGLEFLNSIKDSK